MQTCHRQLRRNNPLKSRCTMLVNIRRKTLAAVEYVNSPDWYSASKLMSRRIELRGNEGGWNNDGTEAYSRGDHTHRRNPRRTGRGDRPFTFHQAKQRSTQSRRTCSGTGRRSYYDSAGLGCDRQKSDHHGDQASGVALTPLGGQIAARQSLRKSDELAAHILSAGGVGCRLLWTWRRSALLSRVDNETLRCRSHVIKRIARHQCELRIFSSIQHLNIIRIDDFHAVHSISEDTVRSCQGDHVVGTNLAHRPKKSVAVGCDPNVSHCARKGSVWNMAGSDAQNARIGSFQNDH